MLVLTVYQFKAQSPSEIREVHARVELAGLKPLPIQDGGECWSFLTFVPQGLPSDLEHWLSNYALSEWFCVETEGDSPRVTNHADALALSLT